MPRDTTNGGGPWVFRNETALASGDHFLLDFRNMKYKGQKGWFKKWLPLDIAQINNRDTGNALSVTYNGIYPAEVLPNSSETYDNQGITRVRVENIGSSSIDADTVTVEVKKEPYGADKAARERKENPWLENAVNEVIPGGTPW